MHRMRNIKCIVYGLPLIKYEKVSDLKLMYLESILWGFGGCWWVLVRVRWCATRPDDIDLRF